MKKWFKKYEVPFVVSMMIVFVGFMWLACAVHAGVSGRVQVSPKLTHTGPAGLTSPSEALSTIFNWAVANGTNANQMNLLFIDQRTISPSPTNETLDLYNSLTDNFGTTLDFARVKFFAIVAASSNDVDILVGGSTAGAWTNWCGTTNDTVKVRPGGIAVFFAPDITAYPVTDATGDKLLIDHSSTNNVTYDIYIGGSS